MLSGKYKQLVQDLNHLIPSDRLITDELRLLAFGTDAGFYRLIPKLVIKVHSEDEAAAVLKSCHTYSLPLTVRAAGTSLSGQAISDSVLMLLVSSQWKNIRLTDDASEIHMQPGIEGGRVNQFLLPHGKRIGPDPASINHAQIGGIVSNNAAGMASGVRWNSYHTLAGVRLLLADGTILDTRSSESRKTFAATKNGMLDRLKKLSEKVKADTELIARIKQKFSLKNTTGYAINALVDFDDPIDMLAHLLVGAEGTLALISEVALKTIPDPKLKATGLVIFPDIATACRAIPVLQTCAVATAELMDRAALRSVENKPAMPAFLKDLGPEATALLVETRANEEAVLEKQVAEIHKKLADFNLVQPLEFTRDTLQIAALWKVRKGLFPSVAASREKGTTVIIEDIAVPQKHLADALQHVQQLFKKYDYKTAIIWGHALDGNVHFVITQNFAESGGLDRYAGFMNELVELVLDKYDGSLKAEHGTGRNMAPFVQREWGSALYEVMRQIKDIIDPNGIMNPGVLLNDDPQLHLKNLKPLPVAHELIDTCIECGFCENSCVSRELTLSPRQRIAVFREIHQLSVSGNEAHRLAKLNEDFDYYGDQTCATDGLCAMSCPVDIDTGKLIKALRREQVSPTGSKVAMWLATHMDRVTAGMRFMLGTLALIQKITGQTFMESAARMIRKLSINRIPRWSPAMPGAGMAMLPHNPKSASARKVVYFSSCINRAMGTTPGDGEPQELQETVHNLLQKAGFEVIVPENINHLCCGMAFASKGYVNAAKFKENELQDVLLAASENGKYPVLADMSPCLYHMKETLDPRLKLYEPIEFTLDFLKDHLLFEAVDEPIAIFPVCSARKMELEDQFVELAQLCSTDVTVHDANCCGFAGDRGFTYPELNAEGLKDLKIQLKPEIKEGFSTSRTCEIGMSEHGGIPYKSILYLVDRVTKSKNA